MIWNSVEACRISKHASARRSRLSVVLCSGVREVAGSLAVASCRGLEPLGTERLPVRGWGRHSLSVRRAREIPGTIVPLVLRSNIDLHADLS